MNKRDILIGLSLLLLGLGMATGCARSEKRPAEAVGERSTPLDTTAWMRKGGEIAALSFQALSSELKQALERGGVQEAVRYCNLKAYPLVDSLSQVHRARIRRTTFKTRNPKDRPDPTEAAILRDMEAAKAAGQQPRPVVQRIAPDTVLFAAPILTQPLCLQCHGEVGKDIDPADYALIRQLYPEDQATGYHAGDLRGMWSIRMYAPPRFR